MRPAPSILLLRLPLTAVEPVCTLPIIEPAPANAAPKIKWSEAKEREKLSEIYGGIIAVGTIVGLFCGWPFGWVWDCLERLGGKPTDTGPVVAVSTMLMFLPALALWVWQVS
jgi:hypothetical protein